MQNSDPKNLKYVLMIIPWLFLLWVGMDLGFRFNPSFLPPAGTNRRKLASLPAAAGDQKTLINLTIAEVRDPAGKVVMPDQDLVYICPGDTVTLGLAMTINGHIGSFTLTDPVSGQPLAVTNPIEQGSPVVDHVSQSFSVPGSTSPGSKLVIPWQAETYIISKAGTPGPQRSASLWYDLVKPIPVGNTVSLSTVTPATRTAWDQARRRVIYPWLLRLFVLAAVCMGLLMLVRKSLLAVLSVCILFVGMLVSFLAWNGLLYDPLRLIAILLGVGAVGLTALSARGHFDLKAFLRLFRSN